MKRVVLFAEALSDNLGDQVIVDSTVHLLSKISTKIELRVIDLSGRSQRGGSAVPGRKRTARVLGKVVNYMPKAAKNRIRWRYIQARGLGAAWKRAISDADLVLIGGGQLLMDNHYRFPASLLTVANICRSKNVPYHLFACGVGRNWSSSARRALDLITLGATSVSVRDPDSLTRLRELTQRKMMHASVVPDPGLWVQEAYQLKIHDSSNAESLQLPIGINIMTPQKLREHASEYETVDFTEFWGQLIRSVQLATNGTPVVLFCNGAEEDYNYAKSLRAVFPTIPLVPKAETAKELVEQIAEMRLIVAHRLHASIIGTGVGLPTIGMGWDDKVESFYKSIERSVLFVGSSSPDPNFIAGLIPKALDLGGALNLAGNLKMRTLEHLRMILS